MSFVTVFIDRGPSSTSSNSMIHEQRPFLNLYDLNLNLQCPFLDLYEFDI